MLGKDCVALEKGFPQKQFPIRNRSRMSDFVSRDLLPGLWEEILQRHWSFLETDESIQKLEEKKKLEDCLREFLSVVTHDRKFFLPETSHVLRKTIREMDEFTAYKAIRGFEAISQYANNLFTKPWRKEFRNLKTYSGYYQHEVKSNLLDAEKLLVAMGYERLSESELVLIGPICPDQVTNVSRDAMAAYVECQIMNKIYSGLLNLGISCKWKDIYHYRERHVGGASQAIKGLAYALQVKAQPKETSFNSAEDFYQQPVKSESPKCTNCALYHMNSHKTQPQIQQHLASALLPQCSHTNLTLNQQQLCAACSTSLQQTHGQIPHSRSLEHYNEPHSGLVPHRHSFDHPQGCLAAAHYQQMAHQYQQLQHPQSHVYESPYDCIGGASLGSSASYTVIPEGAIGTCPTLQTHPYNVSGNRVPLPYNISNQLNNHHYATPVRTAACTCKPPDSYVNVLDNAYASIGKNYNPHLQNIQENAAVPSGAMPAPPPPPRLPTNAKDLQQLKQQQQQQQQSMYPPEQLIDFDDKAALLNNDYSSNPNNLNSNFDFVKPSSSQADSRKSREAINNEMVSRSVANALYAQPVVMDSNRATTAASATSNAVATSQQEGFSSSYGYAQPIPRQSRVSAKQASSATNFGSPAFVIPNHSLQSSDDLIDNNIQLQTELNTALNNMSLHPGSSRRKKEVPARLSDRDITTSDTCDSATLDDFVTVYRNSKSSPSQSVKNQDGVGSYESWNYVFRNLERNGYSKDLGNREDLLMKTLDLDSSLKTTNPPLSTSNPTPSSSALNDRKPSASSSNGGRQFGKSMRSNKSTSTPIIVNLDKSPTRASSSTTTSIQTQTTNNLDSNGFGATKKILKSALKNSNKTTTIIESPTMGISSTLSDIDNKNFLEELNEGAGAAGASNATYAKVKKTSNNLGSNSSSTMLPSPSLINSNSLNLPSNKTNTTVSASASASSVSATTTTVRAKQPPPVSTQVIVTKPNEWSCRFCTFLNPDSKRICDMCYRSKDFNLEASAVTHASTCV